MSSFLTASGDLVGKNSSPEQQAALKGNPAYNTSSTGAAIVGAVGGIFKSSSYSPGIAEVDRRYAAAISGNPANFVGDQSALESLLSGAGRDPNHPGGFADNRVEAYSYQKYQEAVAVLAGGGASAVEARSGPPAGGGSGIADTLAGFLRTVTAPSGQAAGAAAGQAAAKQAQSTLLLIGTLVAGAIVVGALLLRRR